MTMVCGSYKGGVTGVTGDFVRGVRRGQIDGIDVVEFNLAYSNSDGFFKRSLMFLKFALRSIGLVFFEKYDLVFATTTPLTAGIPGVFARWLRRKPFVFEVRDLWPELPKQMGVIKNPLVLWGMSLLEWISYRSAHRCIGLSPGIVEGIVKRGVHKDRIQLVPNGCDLEIFGRDMTPWRPDGVLDEDLMAVFTGTHGVANGLNAVIEVAQELKSRNRLDIKLVLVGQGKLKEQLQQKANENDLDNIVFHPPVNKETLAGLMAKADIGMQLLANVPAFYFGTSPNKFFDYISAGLPVLNNYPGWLADMIVENECGYVVPPDDPVAFADALVDACDCRSNLKPMGRNSRKLAESMFNREDLADQWVDWVVGSCDEGG